MEEKDIKELWKKGDELNTENYSPETVEKIIQSQPKDLVSKFIKTLKIEFWINLITLSVLSIYMFYKSIWYAAISLSVANILIYLYYSKLIKNLSRSSIDIGVVQYLCIVYKIIKHFILHYKLAIWIVILPTYFLSIYLFSPNKSFFEKYSTSFSFYLIIIIGLVIAILLTYLIFHLFYGKKANKIKKMIETLKKEELK